jgi:uncharacterized protein (DUF2235 family)
MKKIVLLSDGTGNSAAKKNKTNVWRLYAALDLHQKDQIAMYDDGVGSKDSTWSKVLGGAFGIGLRRNVLELYKYLCRNYCTAKENQESSGDPNTEADKIYMFGFSRGAFTVRVLAAMVAEVGLCTDFESEQQLNDFAKENFRVYRDKYEHGILAQLIWKLFRKKPEKHSNVTPNIEVVGVWDTVDAYVLPMDELAILWDFFIYPIRFTDYNLAKPVQRAYHAVSVDDERHTFHPVMWNEANGETRIEQVWFPGVHADVGGGYPRRSLSLVALDWMLTKVEQTSSQDGLLFIEEIREQYQSQSGVEVDWAVSQVDQSTNQDGLVFIKDIRDQYKSQSDWNGPQHNSRSGFATYYRYKPRNIAQICNHEKVQIKIPKIHRSVLERTKGRSVPYAPTGIPAGYELISTEPSTTTYEDAKQAKKRADALNYALDIIFWRRGLYFAVLITTLALIASRFFLDWNENGICKGSACFIDPVLQLIINSLPDFVSAWFEALRQNPLWLRGFFIIFGLLFILRGIAWRATQKRAMCAWAALKGKPHLVPEWKETFTSKLRNLFATTLKGKLSWISAGIIFLLIVYLLIAVVNGVLFHFRYTTGSLCRGSNTLNVIATPRTIRFDIDNPCYATGIKMEEGKTYRFHVPDASLRDGPNNGIISPDGISPISHIPFVPFRRHMTEPWIKLYAKIGNDGFEDFVLGKGTTEYTARADGELFLYVNDGVFGLLPDWDLPYKWERGRNSGKITVTVTKLPND